MLNASIIPRVNSLCRAFSHVRLNVGSITPSIEVLNTKSINKNPRNQSNNRIAFAPRSISIIESPSHPFIPHKEIIDINILNKIIETPYSNPLNEIIDQNINKTEIVDPAINPKIDDNGIQAALLIVIRRRKMKKHKLKKLRKKMKFEWAKVRQRREMRKEKAFQAGLIAQIKEAEKFSAEQYVAEKIRMATEVPIPRFWKGKRLPQFIIKQKLGIK